MGDVIIFLSAWTGKHLFQKFDGSPNPKTDHHIRKQKLHGLGLAVPQAHAVDETTRLPPSFTVIETGIFSDENLGRPPWSTSSDALSW